MEVSSVYVYIIILYILWFFIDIRYTVWYGYTLLLHFFIIFVVTLLHSDLRWRTHMYMSAKMSVLFFLGWEKTSSFFCSSVGSRVQSSRYSSSSEAITCIDIASRAADEFADTIGCQWRPLRFSRKADTNASSIVSQSLAVRPYWRSEPENSNHFQILGVSVCVGGGVCLFNK